MNQEELIKDKRLEGFCVDYIPTDSKKMKRVVDKDKLEFLKAFILDLLEAQTQDFKRVIQARLDYCLKQNGLHHCKNCGLNEEDIKAIEEL